ncbi:Caspase-3 [Geodia barretti]|uniref:Caspase-3 n=1 Tax=Geodia barretti TaxID=519541 RepID=A0AA35XM84_GEOBA|nr:Caspase-3 [Geodia barretti]
MADIKGLQQRYGLTDAELGKKCEDEHLTAISRFISWDSVGPYLKGVTRQDMKDIRHDGQYQQDKRGMLIDKWEETGSEATYGAMITAMVKARKRSEAEKVCELLRPQRGPKGPKGTSLADSPGLAILINCTYENCDNPDMTPLRGTAKDAAAMIQTFDSLNYVVHKLDNPTKAQILAKIKEVSASLKTCSLSREEAEEKVVFFAFSGHGTTEDGIEKIYANDGETVQLKDIVYFLTAPPGVQYVPKLFLVDACRGAQTLSEKGVGGGVGAAAQTKSAPSANMGFVKKLPRRSEGNYYIAYATVPHHVSWGGEAGSLWMPKLAKALWNEPFQMIVSKVMREVSLQFEQQCNSDDPLNVGPLYLQKKLS